MLPRTKVGPRHAVRQRLHERGLLPALVLREEAIGVDPQQKGPSQATHVDGARGHFIIAMMSIALLERAVVLCVRCLWLVVRVELGQREEGRGEAKNSFLASSYKYRGFA